MSKEKKAAPPPELAIGMRRTPIGWQVVKTWFQNGRVIREEKTEPDLRAIALERFQKEITVFWDPIE